MNPLILGLGRVVGILVQVGELFGRIVSTIQIAVEIELLLIYLLQFTIKSIFSQVVHLLQFVFKGIVNVELGTAVWTLRLLELWAAENVPSNVIRLGFALWLIDQGPRLPEDVVVVVVVIVHRAYD